MKVATYSYFILMKAIGIESLRNRLSEYIRLAMVGETVLVTDHDRVVAELVPQGPDRSPQLADALLAEAVRKGWVTAPLGAAGKLPVTESVSSLSDLLSDLRDDRDAR